MVRMLPHQQRLGFPIARLLFQVSPHRRAPIVPDKPGGTEPNLETVVLQAPANVHVVSRAAENRVKQPDPLQPEGNRGTRPLFDLVDMNLIVAVLFEHAFVQFLNRLGV